jgi:hypothetical protein
MQSAWWVLAAWMCCAAGVRAQDAEAPAANPGRPTVTSPATLTPVGYLQFEQGYLGSLNSPETESQYGLNQAIKLAVHPRVMLEVQSQPFAASQVAGTDGFSRDPGDVLFGGQVVLWNPPDTTDESVKRDVHRHAYVRSALPTIAVAYLNRVRSGTAADIDLGSQSRVGLLLFSGHAPGLDVHYDINLVANEQPDEAPTVGGPAGAMHDVRRAQFGETFSVDRPFPHVNPNLQFSAEIYRFSQPLVHATSSGKVVGRANLVGALLALGYQIGNDWVLDCGFEHGLTSTSTQWQSFAGFTYLLPKRLWPQRSR